MRSPTCIAALALFALFAASAAQAANETDSLQNCVDLSTDHQAVRFGTQYLLIKDGERHYRLGLTPSCDAVLRTSQINISTDKQANRLCPQHTKLSSRGGSCNADQVELIEARDFERYRRAKR